jgi:hypothetical protein
MVNDNFRGYPSGCGELGCERLPGGTLGGAGLSSRQNQLSTQPQSKEYITKRKSCQPTLRMIHTPHNFYHKVLIYTEYHSVCLLVGIGTPQPLSRKRVCPPPPEPKGGGGTLACGWGSPNSRRLEKRLSTLPTLCFLSTVLRTNVQASFSLCGIL